MMYVVCFHPTHAPYPSPSLITLLRSPVDQTSHMSTFQHLNFPTINEILYQLAGISEHPPNLPTFIALPHPTTRDEAHAEIARLAASPEHAEYVEGERMMAAA